MQRSVTPTLQGKEVVGDGRQARKRHGRRASLMHTSSLRHTSSIRNIEVVRERFLSVTRVAIETTVPPWAVFEPPPRRPARQRDR